MDKVYFYKTSLGVLGIICNNHMLTRVFFDEMYDVKKMVIEETDLHRKVFTQIEEFLHGHRRIFDIPYQLNGTSFQKRVWNVLSCIPYGTTVSYQDVAKMLGNEKASRAVGMANHKNPLILIIPCHRVCGKNGSLTGYAGGLDRKEMLLTLESKYLEES